MGHRYRHRHYFTPLTDLIDTFFDIMPERGFKYDFKLEDYNGEFAFPGVRKEDVHVTHDGTDLRIKVDTERTKKDLLVRLPSDEYDVDKLTAKYEDGLLRVSVPLRKGKEEGVKKIAVQ